MRALGATIHKQSLFKDSTWSQWRSRLGSLFRAKAKFGTYVRLFGVGDLMFAMPQSIWRPSISPI